LFERLKISHEYTNNLKENNKKQIWFPKTLLQHNIFSNVGLFITRHKFQGEIIIMLEHGIHDLEILQLMPEPNNVIICHMQSA
jgi:hypothetical protein